MGDLREDLIRLTETWVESESSLYLPGTHEQFLVRQHAAKVVREIRSLLASHPAPSPSVSRDAEDRVIDAARRLDAACRKHEEHGDNFPAFWIREEIDALRAALDAPSPRSEAESGPCCADRARRGWCDCARAPVPAESATRCTSDGTDIGRRTCDCPKHAATKGEEDGR